EKLAYDSIKSAILGFQLMPDDSLVETDLARQLGISKTPVRDALSRLEKEGFVEKIPYKGYTVTGLSHEKVIEIFEIRAALEGLAARQATRNFTEQDLDLARDLVRRQQDAAHRGDIQAASDLNKQFHGLLLNRAKNGWLRQILGNLEDHLQRYRMLSNFQQGRLEKSVAEHNTILSLIADRQPEKAEEAGRAHLLSVLDDLQQQDFNDLIDRIRREMEDRRSDS
ncbi:MAG TPA: GntR family transcriptional regulator, partial [Anaerolineaceae bacterium]|nr:GntR family transcriptional regulator [Anaerolineaceae bacterium]